jgi:hypothetical protein
MTQSSTSPRSRASSSAATGCRSRATCSCASTTRAARALARRDHPEVLTAAPWSEKPDVGRQRRLHLRRARGARRALTDAGRLPGGLPPGWRRARRCSATRRERARSAGRRLRPGPGRARDGDDQRAGRGRARRARPPAARGDRARGRRARRGDQAGAALPGGTEHFGFADGFAQPSIEGSGVPALPGRARPLKDGGWRPIRAGEFILGYPDEQGVLPPAPAPDQLVGQRLLPRLPQAAPGRRRLPAQLADAAAHLPRRRGAARGEDRRPLARRHAARRLARARPTRRSPPTRAQQRLLLRGRRDGAALPGRQPRPPRQPAPEPAVRGQAREPPPADPPRDPLRRPLPDGAEDDGADRGVVFMCLQASIARQFEFVQSQWLNDGNAFAPRRRPGRHRRPHDGPGRAR